MVVAVPDALHYEAVMCALRADQHVLCVKPLVLKYTQAVKPLIEYVACGTEEVVKSEVVKALAAMGRKACCCSLWMATASLPAGNNWCLPAAAPNRYTTSTGPSMA